MSNLRKYWKQHVFGHFGVAALSGYLSWQNPAAGLLFAGQCVRQVAGFWQKRDTVSIDLAWCVAGFAVGSSCRRSRAASCTTRLASRHISIAAGCRGRMGHDL